MVNNFFWKFTRPSKHTVVSRKYFLRPLTLFIYCKCFSQQPQWQARSQQWSLWICWVVPSSLRDRTIPTFWPSTQSLPIIRASTCATSQTELADPFIRLLPWLSKVHYYMPTFKHCVWNEWLEFFSSTEDCFSRQPWCYPGSQRGRVSRAQVQSARWHPHHRQVD